MMRRLRMKSGRADNVRIGPLSIITLIAVLSLAVLAVLTVSTAHASKSIAERQANSTTNFYLDEQVAQEFVAEVDGQLASLRAGGSSSATASSAAAVVSSRLDGICADMAAVSGGTVTVTAMVEGDRVLADFTCKDGRTLNVGLLLVDGARYRIDEWKMGAVEEEPQPAGTLWTAG